MNSNGEKRRLFSLSLIIGRHWSLSTAPLLYLYFPLAQRRETRMKEEKQIHWGAEENATCRLYICPAHVRIPSLFSFHFILIAALKSRARGGGFWQNPTHQFHPESRRPRMVLCRAEIDSGSSSPRSHAGGSSPGGVKKWTNRVSCNQSPAVFSWWHQSETASLRGNDLGGQKYSTFLRISSTAVIFR